MIEGILRMSLGTYRPHSFVVRIKRIADINPGPDEPFDCAVPTYVHEYIHVLHNLSTPSGVNLFRANLWLLRLLTECTDVDGRVIRREPPSGDLQRWLEAAVGWNAA